MSVLKAACQLMIDYQSGASTGHLLWKTIRDSLYAFTAEECQHFFKATV